jgi:hypothetical protein
MIDLYLLASWREQIPRFGYHEPPENCASRENFQL